MTTSPKIGPKTFEEAAVEMMKIESINEAFKRITPQPVVKSYGSKRILEIVEEDQR